MRTDASVSAMVVGFVAGAGGVSGFSFQQQDALGIKPPGTDPFEDDIWIAFHLVVEDRNGPVRAAMISIDSHFVGVNQIISVRQM